MPKQNATNVDIYNLVDNLRRDIKSDIKDVADQVSALSNKVNDNEVKQAVSSTKIGMIITGITIGMSTLTTILVDKITGRIH